MSKYDPFLTLKRSSMGILEKPVLSSLVGDNSVRYDPLNSITPTSGLNMLMRQGMDSIYRPSSPLEFDAEGNPINTRSLADRLARRKSWVDVNAATPEECHLLTMPPELQFMVIAHLGFGDLERLRRTCRYYRLLLRPDFVRELFGGRFASQLMGTCHSCFEAPGRRALILQYHTRPVSSKCFRCAVQARELRVGTQVPLATTRPQQAWVCRWCGWPVVGPHSWASEQFHIGCYDRYYRVLWVFLILGFVQFSVGVVASALSLVYYKHEAVVFGPTVANFVLLWICMLFLMFRGNRVRTYHWVGFFELVILGLWIAPLYGVARDLHRGLDDKQVFAGAVSALVFFAINMLFRLLNFIGNVVLFFEYDMTKHHVPEITLKRKLFNLLMSGLIYWTYPQSIEQRYPPDFH